MRTTRRLPRPSARYSANRARFAPRIEDLERRQLLATGFLQGTAYTDSNKNNLLDPGDARLQGATIQLFKQQADLSFSLAGSQPTGADGGYLFDGLQPGVYRIVQAASPTVTPLGTQPLSAVNPASQVDLRTIQVTLVDPDVLIVTYDPINYYNNAPSQSVDFTIDGLAAGARLGQIPISVSRGSLSSVNINSFCVNLFEDLSLFDTDIYTVNPQPLPESPGLALHSGQIAYLYNKYGIANITGIDQGDAQVKAASLQLAISEFLYDTTPDINAGNFQFVRARYNGTPNYNATQTDLIRTLTTSYLTEAVAATPERVTFLQGVKSTITNSATNGLQGMLASGSLNFLSTPAPVIVPPASIGDFVWEDRNANGLQDANEPGIAGVTVNLLDSSGNPIAGRTTFTDVNGAYSFINLVPDTYSVQFVAPNGYVFTTRDAGSNANDAKDSDADTTTGKTGTYTLVAGQYNDTVDAGFYKPVTIGDFVWEDLNANGVQDSGEPGLKGVVLTLSNGATATTDANGFYQFTGLAPGTYTVSVAAPSGYVPTLTGKGTTAVDSNASPTGTTPAALASGGSDQTLDFGFYKPVTISGVKFNDKDADGTWDKNGPDNVSGTADDEVALSGWKIFLDANGNDMFDSGELFAITDANGAYSFTGLLPGSYRVREVQQTGWIRTTADADFTLASGQNKAGVDIGNYKGNLVSTGDTATIGFWQNKNGQALIRSFNGGATSTVLGNWLAAQFPNMYGATAGANNLAGKSNDDIANYFVTLFKVQGQKLGAQVLGAALAVYTTTLGLSGSSGLANPLAKKFGFAVNNAGVGADTYNIGTNSAAFNAQNFANVANGSVLTVMDILRRTNARAVNGVLWANGATINGVYYTADQLRNMGNVVFSGINQSGDIV